MLRHACALLIVFLTGCSLVEFERPAEVFYALRPEMSEVPQASDKESAAGPKLLVSDIRATGVLAGNRIIHAKDRYTRGVYQLARWSEPPVSRLQSDLLMLLERRNAFRSVSRASGVTGADFLLNVELLDAYHDSSSEPGIVKVEFRLELVTLRAGDGAKSTTISASAPATEYSARGAVEGFTVAYGDALLQIARWVEEVTK